MSATTSHRDEAGGVLHVVTGSLAVEGTILAVGMVSKLVLTFDVQRLGGKHRVGDRQRGRSGAKDDGGAGLRESGRRGGVNIGVGYLRSGGEGVRRQRG